LNQQSIEHNNDSKVTNDNCPEQPFPKSDDDSNTQVAINSSRSSQKEPNHKRQNRRKQYNKDKPSKPCTAFVPSKRVIVVEHFVIIEKHHPATNWIPLIDWEKQKECDDDENCCCEDDGDLGHEKIYFEQERFFVFSLLQIIL
jgi:hypothetical protein